MSGVANATMVRGLSFSTGEYYIKDYTIEQGDNAGYHRFDAVVSEPDVLELWSYSFMTGFLELIATSGLPSLEPEIEGYIDPYPGSEGIAVRTRNGSAWSATVYEPGLDLFGMSNAVRDTDIAVLRPAANVPEPQHWAFFVIVLAFFALRRRFI